MDVLSTGPPSAADEALLTQIHGCRSFISVMFFRVSFIFSLEFRSLSVNGDSFILV